MIWPFAAGVNYEQCNPHFPDYLPLSMAGALKLRALTIPSQTSSFTRISLETARANELSSDGGDARLRHLPRAT